MALYEINRASIVPMSTVNQKPALEVRLLEDWGVCCWLLKQEGMCSLSLEKAPLMFAGESFQSDDGEGGN